MRLMESFDIKTLSLISISVCVNYSTSNLREFFDAHLLYFWLPDFIWHPRRRTLGLVNLNPLSLEKMNLLRASLPEPYVRIASVCSFQCCLSRRFSSKDAYLVALSIPEGKVPNLFICYVDPSNLRIDFLY